MIFLFMVYLRYRLLDAGLRRFEAAGFEPGQKRYFSTDRFLGMVREGIKVCQQAVRAVRAKSYARFGSVMAFGERSLEEVKPL
jgi:hypothetical protein